MAGACRGCRARAVGLVAFRSADGLAERRQIARVTLEGLITEDRDKLKLLQSIGENKQVAGVILFINSPGGTTTGGEALFEAIRNVAKAKPVVAQFGTVATSAAYIGGLATDHVVARGNTITGSVGVIFQWAEVSQLLDKLGVKMNEIKSGPLKANPSPFQPIDEAGRSTAEQMVAESQKLVRRPGCLTPQHRDAATSPGWSRAACSPAARRSPTSWSTRSAASPKPCKWLEQKRDVPKGLKVVDFKPKRDRLGVLACRLGLAAAACSATAAADIAQLLSNDQDWHIAP